MRVHPSYVSQSCRAAGIVSEDVHWGAQPCRLAASCCVCSNVRFQMPFAVHSLGAGRMQAVCLCTPCCSLHVCMQLIRGSRQMDRTVLVRINQELTPDAKSPSGSFCVLTKSLGKPALMFSSLSATSAARQSPCSTAVPRWPCRPSCSLRRCAAAGCLAAVCPRLTSSTGSIRLLAAL